MNLACQIRIFDIGILDTDVLILSLLNLNDFKTFSLTNKLILNLCQTNIHLKYKMDQCINEVNRLIMLINYKAIVFNTKNRYNLFYYMIYHEYRKNFGNEYIIRNIIIRKNGQALYSIHLKYGLSDAFVHGVNKDLLYNFLLNNIYDQRIKITTHCY